jgi:glutamate carboxypeptidase
MQDIRNYLTSHRHDMLALLERLVGIDSGTYCKKGIDACGAIIAGELNSLGFRTETITEADWGNPIRAERPGRGTRRIFLSAHLDTVCPEGTAAKRPFRTDGNIAFGPGVGDMKGGIVQMIFALKALQTLRKETPPISVFLTGDEEAGSVKGRPYIEAEAQRSSLVLVMEPSTIPATIVVRRWGVGAFYLTIHGKAAHVLALDSEGVSATRELALKILALEGLSDVIKDIKVSVNLVRGGTARQVTAPEARADIDVRVREPGPMVDIESHLRQVAETPILPGIRLELAGRMTRPPMQPNANTEKYLEMAAAVGRELGMEVRAGERTAGSDGCFTAALGVATFDGMGPLTHDICGENERIEIDSLVPRTSLIAGILERFSDTSK